MKLVLIDDENYIMVRYGEFTPEQAEQFFEDAFESISLKRRMQSVYGSEAEMEAFHKAALEAIHFQRTIPEIMVRNEVQLRLMTDTLAKMGLVHGNPAAIEDWMRPYIANEIQRQANRESIFKRTTAKLSAYREQAWDWVRAQLFGGASRLSARIINHFTRKK